MWSSERWLGKGKMAGSGKKCGILFFFVFFVLFCFYAKRRESNGIELNTLEKLRAERLFLEKSVKT